MHEGLHVIDLAGTPRERGRAHGEELRPLIQEGVERWKEGIRRSIDLESPRLYLDRFFAETSFLPAIERWTPHLLDEVRGIGEGAGLPFEDAFAYQLMDEEWLFRYDYAQRAGQPLEHCSTVGVFGEGSPTLLAQNMDLPGHYDGTQTLLRIAEPGGLRAMVFTPAGLIGTTGLNGRGLGVCVNTLDQLGHRRDGLPVAFVMRGLLERETLDDALAFVHDVEHASGQNYAIGDPERIVDVECSARQVSVFAPMATRVYHTNHPLANDDQPGRDAHATALVFGKGSVTRAASRSVAGAASASLTEAAGASALSNSEQRFAYLERALDDSAAPVSVQTIMGLLCSCDVPISVPRRGDGAGMTLGSLIMELSAAPVLHIAPGPPAETEYTTFSF